MRRPLDHRGVSEVIGFVLIFSLLISTIGIVYVGGSSALQDTRDAERVNNAERAFDVLATNLQQIARGDAPRRATEIKLSDATLETTEHRTLSTNSTSLASDHSAGPVPIQFTGGTDTAIIYEAGAVLRTDGDRGVMLREPDHVFDPDKTVIRYVETRGSDQSIAGSTTVLVRAERRDARVLASVTDAPAGETVTFNVTTDPARAAAWERYLEEEIDWESDDPCSTVGTDEVTVTCSFGLNEGGSLYVARTRVRIWIG